MAQPHAAQSMLWTAVAARPCSHALVSPPHTLAQLGSAAAVGFLQRQAGFRSAALQLLGGLEETRGPPLAVWRPALESLAPPKVPNPSPRAVGIYFGSLLVIYLLYSLPMSYIKVARGQGGQREELHVNSKVALCSSHLCRQHAGSGLKEQCIAAELAEASCEGRACLPVVSRASRPCVFCCSTTGATMQQRCAALGPACAQCSRVSLWTC